MHSVFSSSRYPLPQFFIHIATTLQHLRVSASQRSDSHKSMLASTDSSCDVSSAASCTAALDAHVVTCFIVEKQHQPRSFTHTKAATRNVKIVRKISDQEEPKILDCSRLQRNVPRWGCNSTL